MSSNWKIAFLRQADSDFEMFKKLRESKYPKCHWLHYFQMATEKLAKATQCKANSKRPPKIHTGFHRYMKNAKTHPRYRKALKLVQMDYKFRLLDLYGLVKAIEKLAPALAEGYDPNPEYPFESGKDVIAPVDYDFPEITVNEADKFKSLIWLIGEFIDFECSKVGIKDIGRGAA